MARRELGPATLTLVQAVRAALNQDDRTLLVACSGGPDSLALAFAARHLAERSDRGYAAAIVDHGLQPGSADVAERAAGQLRDLGFVDVTIDRVDIDRNDPDGPEAAARTARYRALAGQADRRGATVLLGHTLDDQAETVLLGLARGSGGRSLAGMSVRRQRWLRPLLGVRRSATAASCAELGLTPWTDPHNADPRYARVRVRERVLPVLETELGPGVSEALARTAELLRDDADLLDRWAAERFPGSDTLDCAELQEQPPALRRRIIRLWLLGHGVAGLSQVHLLGVDRLVTDWHGQQRVDLPGAAVTRIAGRLGVMTG